MWNQIVGKPSMENLVKKPDLLSFYIASKIPVSESTRQELLEIDGISYRLRREIELLKSVDLIRCRNCQVMHGPTQQFVCMHVCSWCMNRCILLLQDQQVQYCLPGYDEFLISFSSCMQTVIARRSDMLVMSSDGPLGAYVNPHGFVHEIMTLYKANGLALIGPAVREYSWFPGYELLP